MKTKITILSLVLSSMVQAQTFTEQTIDLEAGYEKDVYYHLNDTSEDEDGDNWHLAFSLDNGNATVLFQESRGNSIYETSFDIADWNTVDTVGLSSETPLYNSPSTWDLGAMNQSPNDPSSGFDLGWGSYDIVTHYVIGTRIFIAKIDGEFYKLLIKSLKSGKYEFQYQKMVSGSPLITKTITKSEYSDRTFVHFDMIDEDTFEREPEAADWQFLVSKYTEHIPTPYPVVGVQTRKGIEVAQIENTHPNDVDLTSLTFSDDINVIGFDWKSFNMGTFSYDITDSLSYVIRNEEGELTHFYFTEYEGSSTGIIKLMVNEINIGIEEEEVNSSRFTVFTNSNIPNTIEIQQLKNCELVKITSTDGKIVSIINNPNEQERVEIKNKGVYFVTAHFNNGVEETLKVSL